MQKTILIALLCLLLSASSAHAGIAQPPTTRGLVGYWSMEDCKLTKATDSSGQGNTGTLTNFALTGATSNWVAGKLGACALNFDGTTDYVSSSQVLTSGVFTMSAWINPARYGGSGQANGIIYQGTGAADGGMALAVYANNSGLLLRSGTTSYLSNSNVITLNRWQHVAVTVNGSSYAFYVDGAIVGQGSGTVALSANSLKLGYWYNAAESFRFFQGTMDDVRVYNRALTGNEIARLYGGGSSRAKPATTRGLVGHWSFEDCKLDKASDDSGNGNTGTLTNFALTGATSNWVAGKRGACALNFDGNNDYVSAGTSTAIGSLTTNVTVSAWINSTNLSGIRRIVGASRAATSNGFTFGTSGAGLLFTTFSVKDYTSTSITLSTNTWTHVVAVMSGFNVTYYVNGVSAQTITGTANGNANTDDPLYIGASTPLGSSALQEVFSGSIDEVRIYNRALSAGEVAAIYNAGVVKINTSTAKLQTGTSLASGLVGHWTFDGKYLTSAKAKDTSGNSNVGTLNGANGKPIPKPGKLGQALTFDGTDDYVSTGLNIDAEPVSVALWINPTSIAAAHCFWCTDNGAWDKGVEITAGTFQVHAGASLVDTSVAATANVWQHVVATYTSADIVLYVNGVRVWNRGVAPGADSGSGLELGRANYLAGAGSRFFNGSIDDVRVYNRALSTSEITALYKLGR